MLMTHNSADVLNMCVIARHSLTAFDPVDFPHVAETRVGCGCCHFDMCRVFNSELTRCLVFRLSCSISQLPFQIIGIGVLRWVGAARG